MRLVPAVLPAVLPAVILTGALSTAAPASAQVARGDDPRGDVRRYGADGAPQGRVDRSDGDLTGYHYRYTRTRFSAVLSFRDLRRSAPTRYVGILLTWEGQVQSEFTELEVESSRRRPAGRASLNGDDCPVQHRIDYRRNEVSMSFPVRCIDGPRVLTASATSAVSDDLDAGSYYLIDRMPRPGEFEGDNGVRVRRG